MAIAEQLRDPSAEQTKFALSLRVFSRCNNMLTRSRVVTVAVSAGCHACAEGKSSSRLGARRLGRFFPGRFRGLPRLLKLQRFSMLDA